MSLVSVTPSLSSPTSPSGSSNSPGGMINYGIKAMDSRFGLLDPKSPQDSESQSNVFDFEQDDIDDNDEKDKETTLPKQSKTQRISQFLQKQGKNKKPVEYEKL